jgi:5-methylcytosine-specific restriction endonuclease McrA
MKAQNSTCTICHLTITEEHFSLGAIHIHHIVPIFKKGARNKLESAFLMP